MSLVISLYPGVRGALDRACLRRGTLAPPERGARRVLECWMVVDSAGQSRWMGFWLLEFAVLVAR